MSRYRKLSLEEHAELGEVLKSAGDYLEMASETLVGTTEMRSPTLKKMRQLIYDLVEINVRLETRLIEEHESNYDVTIYFGARKSAGSE